MTEDKKWITRSRTKTALMERYPFGSEVTMAQAESAYAELSTSKRTEEIKRQRGRHVYLRMVDEGHWVGTTEPYIKVEQIDGISYWAKPESIKINTIADGRLLQLETVSGHIQRIRLDRVLNFVEVMELCRKQDK